MSPPHSEPPSLAALTFCALSEEELLSCSGWSHLRPASCQLDRPEAAVGPCCCGTFCVYGGSFTSIGGRLKGSWQLDAVVDPLIVTDPTRLAALDSLLHQEAEGVAWILRACAVPL